MRILLDHCLDWRLRRSLPGHTVKAVGKLGWNHLKDRSLLAKARSWFDVLVTSDKNLPYQQDLTKFALAVAVLDVPSTELKIACQRCLCFAQCCHTSSKDERR